MASHTFTAAGSAISKAQGIYTRLEILFWDLLFWVMKALQVIRDACLKIAHRATPSLRYHLLILLVVCSFGLISGFCLGFGKALIGR